MWGILYKLSVTTSFLRTWNQRIFTHFIIFLWWIYPCKWLDFYKRKENTGFVGERGGGVRKELVSCETGSVNKWSKNDGFDGNFWLIPLLSAVPYRLIRSHLCSYFAVFFVSQFLLKQEHLSLLSELFIGEKTWTEGKKGSGQPEGTGPSDVSRMEAPGIVPVVYDLLSPCFPHLCMVGKREVVGGENRFWAGVARALYYMCLWLTLGP